MRKTTKKNERENLQVPPLTTATKKWESIDCDRLKVRENTHTHKIQNMYTGLWDFLKDESIWNLIFPSGNQFPAHFASPLKTWFDYHLQWPLILSLLSYYSIGVFSSSFFKKNPKTFPFCIGNGRLFVGYWCCLVRLIISTSFACIIQTREKKPPYLSLMPEQQQREKRCHSIERCAMVWKFQLKPEL